MVSAHMTPASIARDKITNEPWELLNACRNHYWQAFSVPATAEPPTRGVIALKITDHVKAALLLADRIPQWMPDGATFIGWTSNADRTLILLEVPNPVSPAFQRLLFKIEGAISIAPDTHRMARAAGIAKLPRKPGVDCKRIQIPVAPEPLTADVLASQPALEQLNLDGTRRRQPQPFIVAVLDCGIDWEHPYLLPKLWVNTVEDKGDDCKDDDDNDYVNDIIGWDYLQKQPDPHQFGVEPHGTAVAALVVATANRAGVDVRIMPLKVISDACPISLPIAAAAIRYACDRGANAVVIAQQWMFQKPDPGQGQLEEALHYAGSKGVLIICASGNFGFCIEDKGITPARYGIEGPTSDYVITVQGIGKNFARSSYSNRNGIMLAAPGGSDVQSIGPKYQKPRDFFMSSAATSIVGGAAAIVATGMARDTSLALNLKKALLDSSVCRTFPEYPMPTGQDCYQMIDLSSF